MNEKKNHLSSSMKDYHRHLLLSFCLEQKHYTRGWLLYSLQPQIICVWQTQKFCQEFKYLTEFRGWSFKSEGSGKNWPSSKFTEFNQRWKVFLLERSSAPFITCWKQFVPYSRCLQHTRQQHTSITTKANHINWATSGGTRARHFLLCHTGEAAAGEFHPALNPYSKKNMEVLQRVQ